MKSLTIWALILVTVLAPPSMAGEAAKSEAPEAATAGNPFTMENAQEHLMRQGYTNISTLMKDESGKWVGTATKDGKTVPVAVDMKSGGAN